MVIISDHGYNDHINPNLVSAVHSSMKSSTILNCGHVVHVDCWRSSYQQVP